MDVSSSISKERNDRTNTVLPLTPAKETGTKERERKRKNSHKKTRKTQKDE